MMWLGCSDIPLGTVKNTFLHLAAEPWVISPGRSRSSPPGGCKPTTPGSRLQGGRSVPRGESVALADHNGSSNGDYDDAGPPEGPGGPAGLGGTSVMIRNLPEGMARTTLEEVFDEEGFAACYDFLYLPVDLKLGVSFCYAFVNLTSPENAQRFRKHFTGFSRWPTQSEGEAGVGGVDWSTQIQGLPSLIERYRNSPLMHESVPRNFQPMVYLNGVCVAFPPPTKELRAPRTRHRRRDASEQE